MEEPTALPPRDLLGVPLRPPLRPPLALRWPGLDRRMLRSFLPDFFIDVIFPKQTLYIVFSFSLFLTYQNCQWAFFLV